MSYTTAFLGLVIFAFGGFLQKFGAMELGLRFEPEEDSQERILPSAVPTPPTFPSQFNISFAEIETVYDFFVWSHNNGTWYYDWTNRRARFDHDQGQTNNFCGNQGLSPKDTKAPCSLIFTPDEKMYVLYPRTMTCCYLCGKEQGCTILKPDWITSDAKLVAVEKINGVMCYGYAKKGAVATDFLYFDIDGKLCRYHEVISFIDHNLTFYRDSFSAGPQPDRLFDVPQDCNKSCPHPYVPPSR